MKAHVLTPRIERESAIAGLLAQFPLGFEDRGDAFVVYAEAEAALPAALGDWASHDVPDDWSERWRRFHHGRVIGERLWVGPPWESAPTGPFAVTIDPGQAFGTGSHATTVLCLELLLGFEQRSAVLDLGCGSGVLGIAAALLGHPKVFACDNDPLAVEATIENASRNLVDVEAFETDAVYEELPRGVPLWLANIELGPLEELACRPDLPPMVIVSGLLERECYAIPGYEVVERRTLDGWQALRLVRAAG